jgi:hypothetical protein
MLNFDTFEIHRLVQTADQTDSEYNLEYENTHNCVTGFKETGDLEFTAMMEGEFGKTFRLFSDDLESDVKIGDRLIQDSATYDVKGVLITSSGPGRKLEVALVEHIPE